MRVMKFGGAVMKSPEGFAAMSTILQRYRNEPLLLVVSAFSTVTRDLEHAAIVAVHGEESEALLLADGIIQQHEQFSSLLLADERTREALSLLLKEQGRRLREYLRGIAITQELTSRTLDAILSYGEYFAIHIVRHYLQEQGFSVEFADAVQIIVTNDTHRSALPLREKTAAQVEERLKPMLHRASMVITQGFVGRTEEGAITTMGMESSNFSAALLGELLGAHEVIIWTDVEGVRSADPNLVPNTVCLPHLSYEQAMSIALNGVKLLHPRMIEPARRASIPIHIRSAFHPDGESTLITRGMPPDTLPVLSLQTDITILHIDSPTERTVNFEDLVNDPAHILSLTYRKDSVGMIARCSASELQLHRLPSGVPVHTFSNYSLISVIGGTAQQVFTLLAQLQLDVLPIKYPCVELGLQTNVSRIAIPAAYAGVLFAHIHSALMNAS